MTDSFIKIEFQILYIYLNCNLIDLNSQFLSISVWDKEHDQGMQVLLLFTL